MFAGRKIRDTFRENKSINDFAVIDQKLAEAKQNLELVRRQVSKLILILVTTRKVSLKSM